MSDPFRTDMGDNPRTATTDRLSFPLAGPPALPSSDTPAPDTHVPALFGVLSPSPSARPSSFRPASRYRLEARIGQGGMGEVYRAYDPDLDRPLALKVLLAREKDDPDAARRFLEEARVTGRLQHPGIPPVHEVGRFADGRLFLAMKLIEGHTLAELMRQRASPQDDLPRFLTIFETVCQTVAYAHSKGVIHRDLKPANVMVGAFGEVQVMDWGLAKVLDEAERFSSASGPSALLEEAEPGSLRALRAELSSASTQAGWVLGTPDYMPPEQANGRTELLDERTDVFALGALLCVLLTGAPPYGGSGAEEVYQRALRGDLAEAQARLDDCDADDEVVRLARACLAPSKRDRPPNADAVAAALAAHRGGAQARLRKAELERARAHVKVAEERKRRRLGLALALALLCLVVGVASGTLYDQREKARQAAEEAGRAQEEAVRRAALEHDAAAALRDAEGSRQRARLLADSPVQWQTSLAAGLAALQRAEALLAREEGIEPALLRQVRETREACEADERDRRLVARVEEVRREQGQVDVARSRFKTEDAYPRLRSALAEYGLRVAVTPPARAADLLAGRPEAVRRKAVEALDVCLHFAPPREPAVRDWLTALLERIDSDPWRKRVRTALSKREGRRLQELARQAPVERQPRAFLWLLSMSLPNDAFADRVDLLRRAQRRYPGDFWLNQGLAEHLAASRAPASLEEAVRYYTAALALRPENPGVYVNLGSTLQDRGDLDGALHAFRQATEQAPGYAAAHLNVAIILRRKGDFKGSALSARKATALGPTDSRAHHNLGLALADDGDADGALEAHRKAIALCPDEALHRFALGRALGLKGDRPGTMAAYRKAIELSPKYAEAHNNLGLALRQAGDVEEAIACFRKAQTFGPHLPQPPGNLGRALMDAGKFDEALVALKRAHDVLPGPARAGTLALLRECERLGALDVRLALIAAGKAPRDVGERLELAWLCQRYKQQHAAATAFYADAFAQAPQLTEDVRLPYRFRAACCAALAGSGKGKDAPREEKDRAAARGRALEWLSDELAAWAPVAVRPPAERKFAREALARWVGSPDLAGVRDREALERLPEAERGAWRKLWEDARALSKRLERK